MTIEAERPGYAAQEVFLCREFTGTYPTVFDNEVIGTNLTVQSGDIFRSRFKSGALRWARVLFIVMLLFDFGS